MGIRRETSSTPLLDDDGRSSMFPRKQVLTSLQASWTSVWLSRMSWKLQSKAWWPPFHLRLRQAWVLVGLWPFP